MVSSGGICDGATGGVITAASKVSWGLHICPVPARGSRGGTGGGRGSRGGSARANSIDAVQSSYAETSVGLRTEEDCRCSTPAIIIKVQTSADVVPHELPSGML